MCRGYNISHSCPLDTEGGYNNITYLLSVHRELSHRKFGSGASLVVSGPGKRVLSLFSMKLLSVVFSSSVIILLGTLCILSRKNLLLSAVVVQG